MKPETKQALREKLGQIKALLQARKQILDMHKEEADQKQASYRAIKDDIIRLEKQRDAIIEDLK